MSPRRCPKVLIVGAGLGGLTLAAALEQRGYEIRVFERDAAPESRGQGFVVNLETGLAALDRIGLADAVRGTGFSTAGLKILNRGGQVLVQFPSHDAFSIARPALRRLLLGAVSETTVFLGARARRYEEDDQGVTLYFDDGSSARGDLLVACDGVHSALRRQRVGDALIYVGVTIVGGEAIGETATAAARSKALSEGKFMTLTPRGSCYSTPLDASEDRIRWSVGIASMEGEIDRRFPARGDLKEELLRRLGDCHDPVPRYLEAIAPEDLNIRQVYDREALDPGPGGRMTLLGDAAHPMTPYRGLGANLAMLDALDLADALDTEGDVSSAVALYERKICRRGNSAQVMSRQVARAMHWDEAFLCSLRDLQLRAGGAVAGLFRKIRR